MNKFLQKVLLPLTAATSPLHSAWERWGNPAQVNPAGMTCAAANYTTEIISLDPLAMYINGFMSNDEVARLRESVDKEGTLTHHEEKYPDHKAHTSRRIASSLILPPEDPIVECIVKRSTEFVGFIPNDGFEALQVVRYHVDDRHDPHYDWFQVPPKLASGKTCNRVASFFVYLGDYPEGGETCFHYLYPAPPDADPKKFSNINSDDGLGVAIKPITGNAMFWMNIHANNTGDNRSLHSALPIRSGVKYGMNILLKKCWD